jgi:hypothetical protein
MIDGFVECGGIDDAAGLGDRDGFGAGDGGYGDLFVFDVELALGDAGEGVVASEILLGGDDGEAFDGLQLLDIAPLDQDGAGHGASEGDAGGIGTLELAGELLAVDKGQGIRDFGLRAEERGEQEEEDEGASDWGVS